MENFFTTTSQRKKRILIVDDVEINREILKEFLSDEYDCYEAKNGKEGLNILFDPSSKIDVVLLDLIIPECSGIEFLQRLQGTNYLSVSPVVVMTAETSDEVKSEYMKLGAIEFLSKTEHPSQMKMRLRNIINLKDSASLLGEIETDSLTGLYNRQSFFYYAKKLLEENPDTQYDMLMIDIQDFKMINTIHGEATGDDILKKLANYISSNVNHAIFGRYDNDRFVSLRPAPKMPYNQWFGIILQKFQYNFNLGSIVLKSGIYENVDRNLSIRTMCDRAAVALQSTKGDYYKNFAFFDGPISQKQLREKQYSFEFIEAIKNEEFVLWYQPKINPYTGKVVGAEALVRWIKPTGYVSPPGEFLSVFEENGQIVELDEYVFRKVSMQQKKWQDAGKGLIPISINLSRKSMMRPNLSLIYQGITAKIGVSTDVVPLEITESAAIQCTMIRPIVEELHSSGFAVHLDDFGSGSSSLNSLAVLPIDVVKIDKAFVDNIGNPQSDIILETMMSLAKKLNCHIVAEGVENNEQLQFLLKNGVDEIQGYYYSRPLPQEEFEIFVKNNLEG